MGFEGDVKTAAFPYDGFVGFSTRPPPSVRPRSSPPSPDTSSGVVRRSTMPPPSSRRSTMPPSSRREIEEEVFLPLPMPRRLIEPTSKFKSTWIVSSQNAIRARGLFDRYLAAIPAEHKEALELAIVGSWLPIEVAIAHYQACDQLELSAADQLELGRNVSKQLERTLLGTAVRVARQAGVSVWTPLSQLHRLWDRMFIGGGAAVYKVGPKEARIEVVSCSLAHISYFRTGLRGVLLGIGSVFTQKLYVNEVPSRSTPDSIVFRGSWV